MIPLCSQVWQGEGRGMVQPGEQPECGGLKVHAWELSIEEGSAYLSTQTCGPRCSYRDPYGRLDDQEGAPEEHPYHTTFPMTDMLHMEPIPVTVGMATDCPAYPVDEKGITTGEPPHMHDRGHESGSHWIQHPTHCDCDWWPVVTPKPI